MLRVKKSVGGNSQFVDGVLRPKIASLFADQATFVKDSGTWKPTVTGGPSGNTLALAFRIKQGAAPSVNFVRMGPQDVCTLKVFDIQGGVKTLIRTVDLGLKISTTSELTAITLSSNSDTFLELHGTIQPAPDALETAKDTARIRFNTNPAIVSIDYIDQNNYKLRMYPQTYSAALESVPANLPPSVKSLNNAFAYASIFNQRLDWDMSRVVDMSSMFVYARAYNQPINHWNMSKVTNTSFMFNYAEVFNQSLNGLDLSKVTNANNMFSYAYAFNGDMDTIRWESLVNADYMFKDARVFNKPVTIDSPNLQSMAFTFSRAFQLDSPILANTALVTNFEETFSQTYVFNQPLPASANGKPYWVTSSATNMTAMFASAFRLFQDFSNWDVSKVVAWDAFSYGTPMVAQQYPKFSH